MHYCATCNRLTDWSSHCDICVAKVNQLSEDLHKLDVLRIKELEKELLGLRLEMQPYYDALLKCRQAHPEGYTIIDFQYVWLDQERAKSHKLEQQLHELQEVITKWKTRGDWE